MHLTRERLSLWSHLRSLFPVIGSSAWTVMGYFNVVRSPTERMVGFDVAAAADFNSCLEDN